MQASLRAGLLMAFLSLLVAFASAAPLIKPGDSVSLSSQARFTSGSIHAFPSNHVLDDKPRTQRYLTFKIKKDSPTDDDVLVRRWNIGAAFRSLGQKIKSGFQSFGQKVKAGFQKVKSGFQNFGQKVKTGFQNFGQKVKTGFQKVKTGFQNFGQKVKTGFQTFGQKARQGFQKVGHFFKQSGAMIAKFGLKVISTATKVASKIVGFIPGIGKIAGKALEGVSMGTNFASQKIQAKLPGNLENAMEGMEKADKIVGYIP